MPPSTFTPESLPTDPEVWAYFAGYLDADGYVHMSIRRRLNPSTNGRTRFTSPTEIIEVTTSTPATATWLRDTFGGRVAPRPARRYEQRPAQYWQVTGPRAREVMKRVRPWLRYKAPQVDLIMEMRSKIDAWGGPLNNRRYSEDLIVWLEVQRDKLSDMKMSKGNKQGKTRT